jgi:thioesterase domain-containing protein/acyl carrier protein
VRVWEDVLGVERIGIDDDFFELGGHSLLAVELIAEVRRRLGRDVPLALLFSTGTVERLADAIRAAEPGADAGGHPGGTAGLVVPLSRGEGRPLFLVHQAGGNVMSYLQLARSLASVGVPVLGLQARGLDGREKPLSSIEAMAAQYVEAVREAQPEGPYRLGGHSLGGGIAQEMARRLEMAGQDVEFLAAIDVPRVDAESSWVARLDDVEALAFIASEIGAFHGCDLGLTARDLHAAAPEQRASLVVARMKERHLLPAASSTDEVTGVLEVYKANVRATYQCTPQACRADIHVFATRSLLEQYPQDLTLGWGTLTRGTVRVTEVAGEHMSLLAGARAADLARLIAQACGAIERVQPA